MRTRCGKGGEMIALPKIAEMFWVRPFPELMRELEQWYRAFQHIGEPDGN